ncbi:hypothetical protein COY27_05585 [Candidatus Woesearchaeota archaeon CG_4_10_14_0_2_um_filter_33_13]|nr:MAG: hypothetical protein COY27_05585 [Candidatus Woesearchaeota archaeon CG_4_10_14_0_2_um_filter_33_13]
MQTKIEQTTSQNREIIENFSQEVQKILYSKASEKVKLKWFYSARYWAEYMMNLNNSLIMQNLQERPAIQNKPINDH